MKEYQIFLIAAVLFLISGSLIGFIGFLVLAGLEFLLKSQKE